MLPSIATPHPTPALIDAEALTEKEGNVWEENLLPVASMAGGEGRYKKNLPCAFRAGEIGGKVGPHERNGGKDAFR